MIIRQYKDALGNLYSLEKLDSSSINLHVDKYFKELEDVTNKNFHSLEVDDTKSIMQLSCDDGFALKITVNDIEVGFIYAERESIRTLNIISYYIDSSTFSSIATILLFLELYSQKLTLRFTPKDDYMLGITSLLKASAIKLYRNNISTSIGLKLPIFNSDILSYLLIEEI